MDAIIFSFENLRQTYYQKRQSQKEKLLFECQQEILKGEEQIRELTIQINQIQTNINLNLQLINNLNHHP